MLSGEIDWPLDQSAFSAEARSFIEQLLIVDPEARLGSNGSGDVKSHLFFSDLDWEKLHEQSMEDTFVPAPLDFTDTKYFGKYHLFVY